MSGNKFIAVCSRCGADNEPRGKAMVRAMTCWKCQTYFRTGKWNPATVEFDYNEKPAIAIGTKGRFEDIPYEVVGFAVKEELKYRYRWREYVLFNPYHGYSFLSEYNGHWNLIWPIETDPRDSVSETTIEYQGSSYDLYQKYTARVVYATGEFYFDLAEITETTVNSEFVSPPGMLALEQSDDSVLWMEGLYLTPQEVADAFNITKGELPKKSGIGYTQPFNYSFSDRALITCAVLLCLLTFVLHLMINKSAAERVVFVREYHKAELQDQKVLVTPTFVLNDGTKNLTINIQAPVDNDWFAGEFTLINETEGTEYNFTKEVEFYSGYEDGYAWSEGSRHGEAFLSRIPSGRYHINIYPEFSFSNDYFTISVVRDVQMSGNFIITCIGLLLFPAGFLIWKRNREIRRWGDSEYTPYS